MNCNCWKGSFLWVLLWFSASASLLRLCGNDLGRLLFLPPRLLGPLVSEMCNNRFPGMNCSECTVQLTLKSIFFLFYSKTLFIIIIIIIFNWLGSDHCSFLNMMMSVFPSCEVAQSWKVCASVSRLWHQSFSNLCRRYQKLQKIMKPW